MTTPIRYPNVIDDDGRTGCQRCGRVYNFNYETMSDYCSFECEQEPCECGRGPILPGNMVPELCAQCFAEQPPEEEEC